MDLVTDEQIHHQTRRSDRGQAVPVLIGAMAVVLVLCLGLGWFARSLVDAARRTAADAAALAGVIGGEDAARAFAAANGGVMTSFHRSGEDVLVVVRVGRAVARARATGAASASLGVSTLATWPHSTDRVTPARHWHRESLGDSGVPDSPAALMLT
ncbi:MAG: hypothetical protein R2715_01265 [Ilumatobacteraceae bacterium]